ncbi:MAG: hypothetical protein GXP34_13625 [Actinobacteria bacterium]|nr:hypothetical protein [Actinomycetota bacterium]
MTDHGLPASRIRRAHQCLSAILEQAVADGLIGRNPARRAELPRLEEPEHRYLTAEQVARLDFGTTKTHLFEGDLGGRDGPSRRRDRVHNAP